MDFLKPGGRRPKNINLSPANKETKFRSGALLEQRLAERIYSIAFGNEML